jgi:GNAT superfamily N-acetyltransferase
MTVIIEEARPDSVEALQLIAELETHLEPFYPSESRHGFSVEKLLQEAVPFFITCYEGSAAGCGGVKLFGKEYGEIKRMYVRPQFRSLGLGKLMLNHLAEYARHHSVSVLRLETGIYQTEAMGLYERWGFERISPFGAYRADPLSAFYEKHIV